VPPTSQPPPPPPPPPPVERPRNKATGLPHADDIRICRYRVDHGVLIQRPCQSSR
jgi:hypothetical protein